MLSLAPRFDLFNFFIPKDFFPDEVLQKYQELINKNQQVIMDPVDYLNESIQGITIPGITDLVMQQQQTSTNSNKLGHLRMNREPAHENNYPVPDNPLSKMDKEFTVTFRQNQGLLNYFMMYETLFHKHCKPILHDRGEDVFKITLLDSVGTPTSCIYLFQPLISGMDGLEFSYAKTERTTETFDVKFTFNNLDYDFLPNIK